MEAHHDTAPARLPRAFSLLRVGALDSVIEEAATRARAGAPEGTLLHATVSRDAARYGIESEPREGNLYAALVLRPEGPADWAAQLALVGAVSLGRALAEVVQPPAELHYTWPGRLRLNQGDVAAIELLGARKDAVQVEWAVLGLAVNILAPTAADALERAAVQREGGSDGDAADLLERFARQFLGAVARWSDEGLADALRHWRPRADFQRPWLLPDTCAMSETDFDQVDDAGSLCLRGPQGVQRISLAEVYFGGPR